MITKLVLTLLFTLIAISVALLKWRVKPLGAFGRYDPFPRLSTKLLITIVVICLLAMIVMIFFDV